MDVDMIVLIVGVILSIIITYLGAYYGIFKKKLSAIRNCIDKVDDAFADDNLTKEEILAIWITCKAIAELRR